MELAEEINGFLFDLDGVLIDSMPYHVKSYRQVLKGIGLDVEPRELYEREGESAELVIQDILDRKGRNVGEGEMRELVEKKRKIFDKIEETEVFSGMKALLQRLSKNNKLGVVSGSDRDNVIGFVKRCFEGVFDCVITEEDVVKQKPYPEPYLRCLRRLDLNQEEAIVVENAPLGVRSAKDAGILCVAIATYLSEEKLRYADIVFKNHEEFEGWIQRNFLVGRKT